MKLLSHTDTLGSTTAVASGAVLRAANKENGPRRYARASFGVRCHEFFDPDEPAHSGVTPTEDADDGHQAALLVDPVRGGSTLCLPYPVGHESSGDGGHREGDRVESDN